MEIIQISPEPLVVITKPTLVFETRVRDVLLIGTCHWSTRDQKYQSDYVTIHLKDATKEYGWHCFFNNQHETPVFPDWVNEAITQFRAELKALVQAKQQS